MTREDTPVTSTSSYKRLKALVIVLGVLLVGGFALLIGIITYRVINLSSEDRVEVPPETPIANMERETDGTLSIERPEGSQLVSVSSYGDRMTLHFRDAHGADTIIVVHTLTGRIVSRVFVPAS